MNREELLDHLLAEMEEGDRSLEELIKDYPAAEGEIAGLLQTADEVRNTRHLTPSPDYKKRARQELSSFMEDHPRGRQAEQRATLFPRLMRFAAVAASVLLAVLVSGTALAQTARPGEPLYAWKQASERVYRTVHPDRTRADLQIAQRRMEELVDADSPDEREIALQGYRQALKIFNRDASPEEAAEMISVLVSHQIKLDEAGLQVSQIDETIRELEAELDEDGGKDDPLPTLPPEKDGVLPTQPAEEGEDSLLGDPPMTLEPTLEIDVTEDLTP